MSFTRTILCQILGGLLLCGESSMNVRAAHLDDKGDSSSWRMASVPTNATEGLGSWIWAQHTFDKQTCRLWRAFEIPAGSKVTGAKIRVTVDNGYRLFLDGRELGQGAEWRALTEYDVTRLLSPGAHVLAVSAFNEFFQAGLILGLRIEFGDARLMEVKSDASWREVPESENGWETMTKPRDDWPNAKIVTALGAAPWDGRWPLDVISVPPFRPIAIPFWQTAWFHVCLLLLCGIVVMVCIALLFQLALQSNQQRMLNLERARIARDIHDDFGTRLTKIILEGEVAQTELAAHSESCNRFSRINDGLRDVLAAMDEVLWAVNPRRDTLRDFVTYICEYTQTFLQSTAIESLLDVEPDMPQIDFDLPLRRSLLLAVKEAINNAAKHSSATRLVLRIHREEQNVVVVVEDNGKGFDSARITNVRHGLNNMVQRMNEVGGKCLISSDPGKGCRVEFRIPLTRPHPRVWWVTHGWRSFFGRRAGSRSATLSELPVIPQKFPKP